MKCSKCGYESVTHFQVCPNCTFDVFEGKFKDLQKFKSALSATNQSNASSVNQGTSTSAVTDSYSEIKIILGTSFIFTLAGWLSLIYSFYSIATDKLIGGLTAIILLPVSLIIILLGYIAILLAMKCLTS